MKLTSTLTLCALFGALMFMAVPANAQLLGPEDPARSAVVATCRVNLLDTSVTVCSLYKPPSGTRLVIETVTTLCRFNKGSNGEAPVLLDSHISTICDFRHMGNPIPAIHTAADAEKSYWRFGGPLRLYADGGFDVDFVASRSLPLGSSDPNANYCVATINGHLVKLN